MKNFASGIPCGKGIRWMDVKCFKIESSHPNAIFVKYSYDTLEYKEIQFSAQHTTSGADRENDASFDALASEEFVTDEHDKENVTPVIDLPVLQCESMVTEAKKKDLLWMCDELIVPKDYHLFYRDLHVCSESAHCTVRCSFRYSY